MRQGPASGANESVNRRVAGLPAVASDATLAERFVRQLPERLIGDNAYESDRLDAELARRGVELIAPHRRTRERLIFDLRGLSLSACPLTVGISEAAVTSIAYAETVDDSRLRDNPHAVSLGNRLHWRMVATLCLAQRGICGKSWHVHFPSPEFMDTRSG
jgi:hypothetical protein